MSAEARESNPTWLLVAGHYPIYSAGEHGDTTELQTYLVPLFRKYNVDAYFCGHDHLSEVRLCYYFSLAMAFLTLLC